jgi:hypothetical protein
LIPVLIVRENEKSDCFVSEPTDRPEPVVEIMPFKPCEADALFLQAKEGSKTALELEFSILYHCADVLLKFVSSESGEKRHLLAMIRPMNIKTKNKHHLSREAETLADFL